MVLLYIADASFEHLAKKLGVLMQKEKMIGHRRDIANLIDKAANAMFYRIRYTAHVRDHLNAPSSHTFNHGNKESFMAREEDGNIHI